MDNARKYSNWLNNVTSFIHFLFVLLIDIKDKIWYTPEFDTRNAQKPAKTIENSGFCRLLLLILKCTMFWISCVIKNFFHCVSGNYFGI